MYDLILTNGIIIDGTDSTRFRGSVAVRDDKLVEVGDLEEREAKNTIDVQGKVICPGFIDIHAHDDYRIFRHPTEKIRQGVTTTISGNCGFSPFPVSKKYSREFENSGYNFGQKVQRNWNDARGYFQEVSKKGLSLNFASQVGHGTIRLAVMGYENRPPTREEITEMKNLLDSSLEGGAIGLSSNPMEAPGCYGDLDELIELCEILGEEDKYYSSHMRNYAEDLLNSLDEQLKIGGEADIPIQIAHMGISKEENRDKLDRALKKIDRARESSLDVTFDAYPYRAGNAYLTQFLPQDLQTGGKEKLIERLSRQRKREEIRKEFAEKGSIDWENVVVNSVRTDENEGLIGLSLDEISEKRKTSPFDVLCDLIVEEEGLVTAISFGKPEGVMEKVFRHPAQMVMTDGLYMEKGRSHPRLFNTYPKVFGELVRERSLLSLEKAIWKCSGFPAQKLGLSNRGTLKEGNYADLVVFDPQKIDSTGTYNNPKGTIRGIEYVFINGDMVSEKGNYLKKLVGKLVLG
ncbi:MAG: N-acyl-D-amino-acid deacylase family protein [Candidatus Acetothermia bacterium]